MAADPEELSRSAPKGMQGMERVKAHKRWVAGAGAAALLLIGGLAAGPVAGLAQGDDKADISRDQAAEIALAEFPDASVTSIELDDDDGRAVYEVELSNGYDVEVDGDSGEIIERDGPDGDDDRDDDDDRDESGTLDDGAGLMSEASITLEEAITAAQGAAEGNLGDVELERQGDQLIYEVEIGNQDVIVDANDGSIVRIVNDD
jgi:uncharacterized membrane protein YkoI